MATKKCVSQGKKYNLYKSEEDDNSVYLEMIDIKETCVEFWESEGQKSTFVKVKIPMKEWEKIISDYGKNKKGIMVKRAEDI